MRDEKFSKESLKEIEKRLLEIEEEKPRRIHNARDNNPGGIEDEIEALDIQFLDIEKSQLQLKRQFILDRRDSWKYRVIWNIIAPVVVALVTAYAVASLNTRVN